MSALMDDPATLESASTRTRFGEGFLADIWYFAALGRDLKPGKLQRYEILGEPGLLGRDRQGRAYAVRDVCPHRAAPLSGGKLTSEPDGTPSIECPYHGWRFGTDGLCRSIPSLMSDQALDITRIRVRRYPVQESQGMVFIWMAADPRSEDHPLEAPPVFPGVVGGDAKITDQMDFDTHMDHAVVGLMDPTHAPYVHEAWWARSSKHQHDKFKAFEPSELGFVMTRHARSKANRLYDILGGQPMIEITFRLPGFRWEHICWPRPV